MTTTLLVTGIHREELGFGDRVAALVAPEKIDVLRIPRGISNSRTGTDDAFYYSTEHREIYLQLRQQVKGRYRLLIDLHSGLNDAGHCADVYCADEGFLQCLAARTRHNNAVRVIKIIAPGRAESQTVIGSNADKGARTWIPRKLWDGSDCLYVGLEVYLTHEGDGEKADWLFTRDMINQIQDCIE